MTLYPTPANHRLTIDLKDGTSGILSIINLEGHVLETIQPNGVGLASIDIGHLPSGFYIFRHTTGKETKGINFTTKGSGIK